MRNNERYIVHTHWGCFSLDEGAYRDYLAGKLWISWRPGKQEVPKYECELVHVSKEAILLREQAENDAYSLMQERFAYSFAMPFQQRMQSDNIDEMCLSVRSSNGLKRAGINTLGALAKRMEQENGLLSIRNLGLKSQAEIRQCFFDHCYGLLSKTEKGQFWQEVLDGNDSSIGQTEKRYSNEQ